MFPKIFWGSLLQRLRKKYDIRQKELALLLHCTPQHISDYERGRTHPSPEEIAVLSYVYGIDLFEFVFRCFPPEYMLEQNRFREEHHLIHVIPAKPKPSSPAPPKPSESKRARTSQLCFGPEPGRDPLEVLNDPLLPMVSEDHPYGSKAP